MKTKSREKKVMVKGEQEDLEVVRSEGNYVFDEKGKKYIDFVMGWCVGNLGWGNQEIINAISNHETPDYVYPYFSYKPWADLAELLADIAPGRLIKSYRCTGGTEAVEGAMQIAMSYTGRSKFLSIEDSYHGNSIGTLSVSASSNKDQYPNLLNGCYKLETPLDEKAAKKVETILKKKEVAAFIMEPIICNLGVQIPTTEFMYTIQELCNKYGTLLVMDEVASGFGRTGKLFASEHYDLEPDIMCLSKAMSGGYAGIGAVMTTEKIADKVEDNFSFYSTYGWHPRSVDAALATIKFILKNQRRLFENISERSSQFRYRLTGMNFKTEAEIRIKGLAIGIGFKEKGYAEKIQQKALKKGLILNADEDNLTLFPALTVDEETVTKGMDILENVINN